MIEVWLTVGRWLQFAAAIAAFGVPAFLMYGVASGNRDTHRRWLKKWLVAAVVIGLLASLITLLSQSAEMAGDLKYAFDVATVWAVVTETQFGSVWTLRLCLLITLGVIVLAVRRQEKLVIIVGAVIVASLAWLGHGGEGGPTVGAVHQTADVLHALAASFWIGALVVLSRLLSQNHDMQVLHGLRRFSGVGVSVVGVLVVTGLVNAWVLNGGKPLSESITTNYAAVLGVKLLLFSLMLTMAGANRFVLTPRLAKSAGAHVSTAKAIAGLKISISVETVLAGLVLLAVATLGVLEPPSAG